ncbi:3-deoxy-manno-octulosonate cytidylyltransferase (CMP-KDO synthetase) [Hephaestia caeni]|uniref:3-deoxy-manno-octulosonate cytidylyltransferase (CMP-KDO synthetase) n=1 Tax=Hephaestia caeni TaxID=645617 RepID=A0A397PBF7_9SPHN|nr:3-deoxy-manno-octulosonate cytidylyltransferase [Hephaestia caeni]RIA46288.1 3-deoxy-manno-octulosonate cytidylyltransferase (CMP-KDO synthetase) [Hephaestia caeni]
MQAAIIIPARFESTRFPGKPLARIKGATAIERPLISRTVDVARAVGAQCGVLVATDDPRIAEIASAAGVQTAIISEMCLNGTERCAAAVREVALDAEIIVNLQGDAPLTPPYAVARLIAEMAADPAVMVATPMVRCAPETVARLRADEAAGRVGATTVVADGAGDALYFSKRILPHGGGGAECPIFLHLGLYAYRRRALEHYAAVDPTPLEQAEGLEQLRFLDEGIRVRMVEIEEPAGGLWEINNPWDIPYVEHALGLRGIA